MNTLIIPIGQKSFLVVDEMVDRFMSMCGVLFNVLTCSGRGENKQLTYNIVIKFGMANVGDHKTEV